MQIVKVTVLLFLVFLSGCATYTPALTEKQKAAIDVIDVYHAVISNEIKVQHARSNAGAMGAASGMGALGGLIGGLIEAGINKNRAIKSDRKAVKYREMLGGYDFNAVVNNAVASVFSDSELLSFNPVKSFPEGTKKFDIRTSSDSSAVLKLRSEYLLSPDQKNLELVLYYKMQISGSDSDSSKERKVVFQSSDFDWSRDVFEEQIAFGAGIVAQLLLIDLNDTRSPEQMKEHLQDIQVAQYSYNGNISKMKAYTLGASEETGYRYYRLKNGDVYAISSDESLKLQAKVS
ncbi:MAG: hypothetical protein V3W04_01165 [Gammaproteobacteria bacterium]